ncbi:MAG: serine hydrolase [Clostridia bacterium]|nr:serine hydrolase [Clostridia bacterium]
MKKSEILSNIQSIPGDAALAVIDTANGEALYFNENLPLIAASVIKLSLMLEAFRRFDDGTLNKDMPVIVKDADKVPSCGALTYMHSGLTVTVLDLVTLMIIVSDNTATNLMIDILGIESVNRTLDAYGLTGMRLRRKMFDSESSKRGIQNTITAKSVADFLVKLQRGELVSESASREMIEILLNQRLNGKIPFFLDPMDIDVAHKTGEDSGTSHDAGIIFASSPIVAVFLSNNVSVPDFERFIQDASLALVSE